MKLTHLVALAATVAGCSMETVHVRAHTREAGGSPGTPASPEQAGSDDEPEAGAGGQPPTQEQAGAAGEAEEQRSDGGAAGDARPSTAAAGAGPSPGGAVGSGGAAGSPGAGGAAPGKLWGHCNGDPLSPDPQVLCDDPSHSCWKWLDPSDLKVKDVCAPTCDSVQFTPAPFGGRPKSFVGIDPALKAQCEALGGECGRLGPDYMHACYPKSPE